MRPIEVGRIMPKNSRTIENIFPSCGYVDQPQRQQQKQQQHRSASQRASLRNESLGVVALSQTPRPINTFSRRADLHGWGRRRLAPDRPIDRPPAWLSFSLPRLIWHPRPVWPDWAIYWTLGNFVKPLSTINLSKSLTFLGNFCKGVIIFHFSSEIICRQLL